MGWVVTAVVGSALVGAGSSYLAGEQASKSASQATAAQKQASDAQLAFQQQQYEDWKNVYGDTQEQLSKYYNTLDKEAFEAFGIQKVEQEYNRGTKELQQALSQRGLATSGAAAQGLMQAEVARASERAGVRATSEQQVMQQKAGFLGLGLGQQSSLQQGIASTYGQQATMYGQQAAASNLASQQAYAGIGSALGQGVSSYLTYNALQKTPYDQAAGFIGPKLPGGY